MDTTLVVTVLDLAISPIVHLYVVLRLWLLAKERPDLVYFRLDLLTRLRLATISKCPLIK